MSGTHPQPASTQIHDELYIDTFGHTIGLTLIENTKRAGASEAMEAILPYSGESFSVPQNVYILGTMNGIYDKTRNDNDFSEYGE